MVKIKAVAILMAVKGILKCQKYTSSAFFIKPFTVWLLSFKLLCDGVFPSLIWSLQSQTDDTTVTLSGFGKLLLNHKRFYATVFIGGPAVLIPSQLNLLWKISQVPLWKWSFNSDDRITVEMFYPTSDLFTNGRIYGNVEHKLKCQECHSVEKWSVLLIHIDW